MGLIVTTDHAEIRRAIDSWVTLDPVRATSLATVRGVLDDDAWVIYDDVRLAARSGRPYPLQLIGSWTAAPLDELVPALRALPGLAGIGGQEDSVREVAAALGLPRDAWAGQRLFRCDDLVRPRAVAGSAVAATAGERQLLRGWYRDFFTEVGDAFGDPERAADRSLAKDVCWLWLDPFGTPVSLATQRQPVSGVARIGPVYTPPAQRGQGYAAAVTAAATSAVLAAQATPVLFTERSNPTSNKIYQQLGYRPVEDRLVVSLR